MSNYELIAGAIETALQRGGGAVVVLNEAQQGLAAAALGLMAPKASPPVDVNKIAITVDRTAEKPYYRNSL